MRQASLLLLLALPAGALERGPWLVEASSGSARACWRDGGQDDCLPVGGDGRYAVPGSTASWRAKLLPSAGKPVRLAAFGDSGKGNGAQRRVAAAVERFDPDLVLLLGDIAYPSGKDKHYGPKFFEPYAALLPRIPFLPAVGNHDYGNTREREKGLARYGVYRSVFRRPPYYSFDAGPVHFVSLDTNRAFGIQAAAGLEEQAAWLAADLAASKQPWKIVFCHVQLYSSPPHGDHALLRRVLEPVLKEGGADLVLQGHSHLYERGENDGVVYATVGTGGAGLNTGLRKDDWVAASWRRHGFAGVSATGTALTLEFIDSEGAVLDRLELKK